ncbi:MAG: glucosaminidase domain-containing protein [Armatimonadota bacterium]|nr:glucosaminidase domain-containing protein [Armatimonadota bacterium]
MRDYPIQGSPTISRRLFRQALENRDSPAAPLADEAYNICVAWGVNPAVALAFFIHESNAGTKGAAVRTKNWGNLRRGPGQLREAHTGVSGAFGVYASWLVSLNDFCKLLTGPLYAKQGLTTVSKVTPKYAPAADRNNPAVYAAVVNQMISQWELLTKREGSV